MVYNLIAMYHNGQLKGCKDTGLITELIKIRLECKQ